MDTELCEFLYIIGLNFWLYSPFVLIPVLLFFPAPYGKFSGTKLGLLVNGKWGWFIQELISPVSYLTTIYWLLSASNPGASLMTLCSKLNCYQMLLMDMWTIHYFNRTVIYTIRMPSLKPSALVIVLSAVSFNVINGFINGYAVVKFVNDESQLSPATLAIGIAVFAIGMYGNIVSDNVLLNLRKGRDPKGYYMPEGGLYEYITCPNYFCEIVEWTGYAIASHGASAALGFVGMTFANLMPRAVATRQWYREKFREEFPQSRKAIIPFIL